MTMNDTWGFKSYDHNWKSTQTLIRNLVDIASKGGNYLLNVGPTCLGEIPEPSIQRLKEIGKWMKVNGESIYATTASPFFRLSWGRCTKKLHDGGATLYLHVFDWPGDGKLLVPGLHNEVRSAWLLATDKTLTTTVNSDGVVVEVPAERLDPIDTVVALEVKGELNVETALPAQEADGSLILPVTLADIHGGGAQVEEIGGQPNIGFWTNARDWVSWQFKLTRAGRFDVTASIATPAQSSRFDLAVADQKLTAEVSSTGSYQDFKTVKLGTIELKQPGTCELSIRPVRNQWQAINLRLVTLRPAE
jgi:alpha-L-fucosidase